MIKIVIEFNDRAGNENSTDIESEDLKFMKEIAKKERANKYNTASLSPEFKVTFAGVKETAVAGEIIKYLKNELLKI